MPILQMVGVRLAEKAAFLKATSGEPGDRPQLGLSAGPLALLKLGSAFDETRGFCTGN